MVMTPEQQRILRMRTADKYGNVSEEKSRSIISAAITEIQAEMLRLGQAFDSYQYDTVSTRMGQAIRQAQDRVKRLAEKIEGEIEVY